MYGFIHIISKAMIKVATFNLENLFTRPVAMNQENDTKGRLAIEDHAIANSIIIKDIYTGEDKNKLIELSKKYKWHLLNPPKNALVKLQKIRGQLFRKPKTESLKVIAGGRKDWVGWFELAKEDVNWKAIYNTGRVINEVNPDILITVEVEDRPALQRFNDLVLKAKFQEDYPYNMLIDGNDDRGIDIGIMSKFPIQEIRSHIKDLNSENRKIFSRDCPEYDIILPGNKRIILLPNHFKSKRNGVDTESQNRRIAQGKRVHEIAISALSRSAYVLVAGDLNDTPESLTLKELLVDGFTDVQSHTSYPKDRPGTFNTGSKSNKIDYLIMSPELRSKLKTTGIERRGSYHPGTWLPFDTITSSVEEASDHHMVWAEFDL